MFSKVAGRAVGVLALLALGVAAGREPVLTQASPDTIVALTGGRVIDGTGAPPIERATILIRNGGIDAVGPASALAIPAGATRVDMAGKTILPGLVNAHGHVQKGAESTLPVDEDLLRRLRMYAAYGVTTVVSLGSAPVDELPAIRLQQQQGDGPLDRARVHTSGRSIRAESPEEARAIVDRLVADGVDRIKFHLNGNANDMSPATWGAIIEQAHTHRLRVAAHIFYLKDAKAVLDKGIDVIGHSVRDQDVDRAFIDAMKRRNVGYVPTLTREVSVFAYEATPAFFSDPFFQRGISLYREQVDVVGAPAYQQKVRNDPAAQAIKKALEQARRNLRILSEAGVTIGMGTDTGAANNPGRWQGYFEHVELEMMVEAGLTPAQALASAGRGAARVSALDRVGTIERGRYADLLVLNANPLEDIRNTRRIDSVWIGGRRITPAATGTSN